MTRSYIVEVSDAINPDAFERFEQYWSPEQELIRCKDCKHRDPEDKKCDFGHDILWELPRPDEWFCADGKRKES